MELLQVRRFHAEWQNNAMRTTIDRAGRIVVPKDIRARLQLLGGGAVEISERDGVIEIVPAAAQVTVEAIDGVPVARPVDDLPPLTDEQIRSTLDRTRR